MYDGKSLGLFIRFLWNMVCLAFYIFLNQFCELIEGRIEQISFKVYFKIPCKNGCRAYFILPLNYL